MTTFFSGLILLIVFLLLWGGHWLPWRVAPALVDVRGDLKRVPAYIYGVTCILIGFAAWCAMQANSEPGNCTACEPMIYVWDSFAFLVMDVIAAGVGTVVPRIVRWALEAQARKGDLEDLKHGPAKR